jgi:hypothetical protein
MAHQMELPAKANAILLAFLLASVNDDLYIQYSGYSYACAVFRNFGI